MHRIIKVGVVSIVTLFAAVTVATGAVKSGEYSGITENDSEPITLEIGKKPGKSGKWVKSVFVEQSEECGEDLEFTKDDKIKNGKFKVVIKSDLPGVNVASVKGSFPTEGIISGTLAQVTCDGNEDDFAAYLEE